MLLRQRSIELIKSIGNIRWDKYQANVSNVNNFTNIIIIVIKYI